MKSGSAGSFSHNMFRSGVCPSKSILRRTITSSVAKLNAAQDLTHAVVEEKKDISSMDQLLRVVSESSRQFSLQWH